MALGPGLVANGIALPRGMLALSPRCTSSRDASRSRGSPVTRPMLMACPEKLPSSVLPLPENQPNPHVMRLSSTGPPNISPALMPGAKA
jgi:hypothetical protein